MTITLDMGIELLDGSMFDYNDPDVSGVSIEMLADVLSRINRFAGHTKHFYSVAQHSVNTSIIVAKGHERDALLHDTSEAFTNDLPTPLKCALPGIREIEQRIEARISEKFGTTFPLSPEVKYADLQMLKIEKETLKPSSSRWVLLDGVEIPSYCPVIMEELNPREARDLFLNHWSIIN
jgi:uncharacterized protein